MKKFALAAVALSLAAFSASAANAQDKPTVTSNPTTGKPVVVVPMKMSLMDQYKAQWVYRNLDDREVKRLRASGYNDDTVKAAANIALRAGLPLEYVLRRVREVGEPLSYVAAMYNVPTGVLKEDIPGYGVEAVMVAPPSGTM